MGKALSSWQRAERAAERQREKEQNASMRRSERLSAAADRARERAQQRDERARDRDRVRQEKEREREAKAVAKQESIDAARMEAEQSRAYIDGLGGLHRAPFSHTACLAEFEVRASRRRYVGNTFTPAPFTGHFVPGVFTPVPFYPAVPFSGSSHGRRSMMALVGAGVLTCGAGGAGAALADLEVGAYAGVGGFAVGLAAWAYARVQAGKAYDEDVARAAQTHARGEAQRRADFDAFEANRVAAFQQARNAHEWAEMQRRQAYDQFEAQAFAQAEAADVDRVDCLRAARNGDVGSQAKVLEAALPFGMPLRAPDGFVGASVDDHEVAYRAVDGRVVELVVIAPDLDVVPDRAAELNAAGEKVKYKVIPEKERLAIYNRMLASLALANAVRVFAALPHLSAVVVEAGAMLLDGSVGRDTERVTLRVTYAADRLATVNVQSVDAVEVLRRFEHEQAPIGSRSYLQPRIDRSAVMWSARIDDPVDVPYGLVPEQTEARLQPNPHAFRMG